MKNLNLSKLLQFFKIFRYGDRIHPARDWFTLIASALVLLLVSVAFNVWLFLQIANGKSIVATPITKPTATSTISVIDVQNVFKGRAAEETNYQHNYHFVDPSLPGS